VLCKVTVCLSLSGKVASRQLPLILPLISNIEYCPWTPGTCTPSTTTAPSSPFQHHLHREKFCLILKYSEDSLSLMDTCIHRCPWTLGTCTLSTAAALSCTLQPASCYGDVNFTTSIQRIPLSLRLKNLQGPVTRVKKKRSRRRYIEYVLDVAPNKPADAFTPASEPMRLVHFRMR